MLPNLKPEGLCHFWIFQGQLNFFCSLTSLTLRQVVKYLYIFKWSFVSGLNENFAAAFLIIWNIFSGIIFCFTTYFLGYHDSEINYYFCVGKNPPQSIFNLQSYTSDKKVFLNQFLIKNY